MMGQASAMISFSQFLGGTIGLTVSSTAFTSTLGSNLVKYAPNAAPYYDRVRQSVTDIYGVLPTELRAGVIEAYVQSLKIVFLIGSITACLAVISAIFIQNIRISGGMRPAAPAAAVDAEKQSDGEAGVGADEKKHSEEEQSIAGRTLSGETRS